jgi:hypothetical protein
VGCIAHIRLARQFPSSILDGSRQPPDSGSIHCCRGRDIEPDEAIEEIRSIRRQIAKECADDPHKLAQYYLEQQKQNAQRIRKTTKRSFLRADV